MKKRVPWILVVLSAVVVGALLLLRDKPERVPVDTTAVLPSGTGAFTPAKVDLRVPLPRPNLVEIQDGKTIDFSTGLPLIKDSEKDKAALDRALKDIEAAAAEVSFDSPQTPSAEKKSATP